MLFRCGGLEQLVAFSPLHVSNLAEIETGARLTAEAVLGRPDRHAMKVHNELAGDGDLRRSKMHELQKRTKCVIPHLGARVRGYRCPRTHIC
jgi:hypothetical protein